MALKLLATFLKNNFVIRKYKSLARTSNDPLKQLDTPKIS